MADEREKTILDLEVNTSTSGKNVDELGKKIKDLGSKDSLKGLVEGFNNVSAKAGEVSETRIPSIGTALLELSPTVAIIAATAALMKESFNLAMEAEDIKAVNQQFEILARNAGVTSRELREGIEASTKGWLDDDSALKMANESLLRLGASAQRLPEIFQLGRKAALALGTDSKETADQLSMAIATGNQRMLKRFGLSVDMAKAEKEYAKTLGVTANELSEQGKIQARLNAVLAEGSKKFQGISEDIKPLHIEMEKLGATLKSIGNSIVSEVGPAFSGFFQMLAKETNNALNSVKVYWNSYINGAKDSKSETERLNVEIDILNQKLKAAEGMIHGPVRDRELANIQKTIEQKQKELDRVSERGQEEDQKAYQRATRQAVLDKKATQSIAEQSIDIDKLNQKKAKGAVEYEALQRKGVEQEVENADTELRLAQAQQARKLAMEAEFEAKKKAIQQSDEYLPADKFRIIQSMERQHEAEMSRIALQGESEREKMWDKYEKHANGALTGISRGFQAFAKKSSLELVNWGQIGEKAADTLSGAVGDAFESMGEHASDGQNKMTSIVLGGLGDIASAYGGVMLKAGLFPFNPVVLAAGAALKALGGALKSVGHGSSAGGVADSGGGSGGGDATATAASSAPLSTTSAADSSALPTAAMAPVVRKQVTVNVNGSVIDTQTKLKLIDMIREGTDDTDYKVQFIGRNRSF